MRHSTDYLLDKNAVLIAYEPLALIRDSILKVIESDVTTANNCGSVWLKKTRKQHIHQLVQSK